MKQESQLQLIGRVIAPFRRRAALVLMLALADTALTSLGVAIVLPLFQVLITPDKSLALLNRIAPFMGELSDNERVVWLAGATIALFLLKGVVSMVSVSTSRGFSEHLRVHWMRTIGERYLFARYASLQSSKQGALLNNWFNESGIAARFFVSFFTYISSMALVGALVVLGLLVNWKAMLVFLVVCGTLVFLMRHRTFGAMTHLGQLKVRLHQAMNAAMAESLLHVRDLKLLGAEPARLTQIDAGAKELKSVFVRIAVMSEVPRIVGESLAVIILMALVVGGVVIFKVDPRTFLPLLAFFFLAFYRLMTTSMAAMTARMKAMSDLHSVRLMQQLLHEADQCEDRVSGAPPGALATDIRFEQISFGYDPAQPVVCDLTLSIPKGRVTLLMGPSGAGKSSLLDLLLRLHKPTAGRIIANGRDISEFNLVQWRRCFGYVSQEAALFNGTIRSNLLLADPQATEAQMQAACRLAGADDFIRAFPQGYDTVVGDRGYTVSGGQRKRIAIARALMVQPQVLILDEATTSFEQSLEKEILQALRQELPELTVIQVTHRLQAAADADWVIALESGRLVGSGDWSQVQRAIAARS